MVVQPSEEFDENTEMHWEGSQLPADVYDPGTPSNGQAEAYDDDEVFWSCEIDGWHTAMGAGWRQMAKEPCGLVRILGQSQSCHPMRQRSWTRRRAYENKAPIFLQSRQLQRAKGTSRGFTLKSKGKGKKGKGYGYPT